MCICIYALFILNIIFVYTLADFLFLQLFLRNHHKAGAPLMHFYQSIKTWSMDMHSVEMASAAASSFLLYDFYSVGLEIGLQIT